MITNANLIALRSPATPDGSGGETAGTLTTLARPVRICVDQPTNSQLFGGANKIADLQSAMYVPINVGVAPEVGSILTFRQDGQAECRLRVARVRKQIHAGFSHYELMMSRV